MRNKGLIFVISAPSGAGKTSLCRGVCQSIPNLHYSISHTTRPPRQGEIDGQDYLFISEEEFRKRIDGQDFLEWAEVYGNLYGTSREIVTNYTEKGIDVILDVDAQGAMNIKKKCSDGVYVYILPPSLNTLKQRLTDRNLDSEAEIAHRLQKAREEIWNYRQYYYLLINEDYAEALRDLEAIIRAERIKTRRMDFTWIEETFIKQIAQSTKEKK